MTAQTPSAAKLYAILTYLNDEACLFVQQMTAEKKQIKDYFRKLLANIEVGQPPQLNHETANQISHFASMYHGSAAAEIASVIVEFIRDVSSFIPCFCRLIVIRYRNIPVSFLLTPS